MNVEIKTLGQIQKKKKLPFYLLKVKFRFYKKK